MNVIHADDGGTIRRANPPGPDPDPEAVAELELALVVGVLEEALGAIEYTTGFGWGAALVVAVMEYLRDRGHDVDMLSEGPLADLVHEAVHEMRVAMRDAVFRARAAGRL